MTLYLLDTDTISLFQLGHAAVIQRVNSRVAGELAISIISVEEQLGGWYTKLRQTRQKDALARIYQKMTTAVRLLSRFNILSYSEAAMDSYADLHRTVRNVRKNDLRIAAIALEHNAVLVSRNLRDFRLVPGLQVEDWTQ